MRAFVPSISGIAAFLRSAVPAAGAHSSPETRAPAAGLSFDVEIDALEASGFALQPQYTKLPLLNPMRTSSSALALAAPASFVSGAALSSDAELFATWLLQPLASELPAMRKYASTFCVAADSAIHVASNSTSSLVE